MKIKSSSSIACIDYYNTANSAEAKQRYSCLPGKQKVESDARFSLLSGNWSRCSVVFFPLCGTKSTGFSAYRMAGERRKECLFNIPKIAPLTFTFGVTLPFGLTSSVFETLFSGDTAAVLICFLRQTSGDVLSFWTCGNVDDLRNCGGYESSGREGGNRATWRDIAARICGSNLAKNRSCPPSSEDWTKTT